MPSVPSHLLISEKLFEQAKFLLARFSHSYTFSLLCTFRSIVIEESSYVYLYTKSYVPVSELTKSHIKQELFKLEKVVSLYRLKNADSLLTEDTLTCFNYIRSVMQWFLTGAPNYDIFEFSKELNDAFYLLDLDEAEHLSQLENTPF